MYAIPSVEMRMLDPQSLDQRIASFNHSLHFCRLIHVKFSWLLCKSLMDAPEASKSTTKLPVVDGVTVKRLDKSGASGLAPEGTPAVTVAE
jgi:hypothetical protein